LGGWGQSSIFNFQSETLSLPLIADCCRWLLIAAAAE
jgi:hypothetical protein